MTEEAIQILENALNLPPEARAFLAEKLLESLDAGSDFHLGEEWRQEIARRCLQIDQGSITLIPAEEIFRKAYEALEK
jgi:putative addiction module component (TIGR02574 family)